MEIITEGCSAHLRDVARIFGNALDSTFLEEVNVSNPDTEEGEEIWGVLFGGITNAFGGVG